MKTVIALMLLCAGCASAPMTPYQAAMVDSGFQEAAGGFYRAAEAYRQPVHVYPDYNPMYSPVFNPVPIPAAPTNLTLPTIP